MSVWSVYFRSAHDNIRCGINTAQLRRRARASQQGAAFRGRERTQARARPSHSFCFFSLRPLPRAHRSMRSSCTLAVFGRQLGEAMARETKAAIIARACLCSRLYSAPVVSCPRVPTFMGDEQCSKTRRRTIRRRRHVSPFLVWLSARKRSRVRACDGAPLDLRGVVGACAAPIIADKYACMHARCIPRINRRRNWGFA